jgi:hypothetical protein
MTKWEYRIGGLIGMPEKVTAELNEMGAEGWELIFCEFLEGDVMSVVVKRPIAEQSEPEEVHIPR